MVGRLDVVCNRGVGKEVMGEGEDNRGAEERDKAHPFNKTSGETQRRHQKCNDKVLNNQPMMAVDVGQGGMQWAIEGWASEVRGEGKMVGEGK